VGSPPSPPSQTVSNLTSPFVDPRDGYRFRPHEMPVLPGSPANPDHPAPRKAAYLAIGLLLALTGGAQNGFLLANTPALQATLDLTPVETGWLTVAFYSTYACMSMLLFRVRQERGIQPFVRWAMSGLVLANLVQLIEPGQGVELAARAIAGIVASGLSALSLYYLMQGLPASKRIAGIVISVGLSQVAFPLARALSPALLVEGQMDRIFLFQFGLSLLALGSVILLRLPPGIRQKTFEPLDLPSFGLFLIGVTALCAFFVQGRIQWWDTPWLGGALVVAILGFDLPPSEWPKICFRFGHEGGKEWRGNTSRKRSSASCVKLRSCWLRAERWQMRAAGSALPSRATTAGARNMAV
jgi:hypothetical protein